MKRLFNFVLLRKSLGSVATLSRPHDWQEASGWNTWLSFCSSVKFGSWEAAVTGPKHINHPQNHDFKKIFSICMISFSWFVCISKWGDSVEQHPVVLQINSQWWWWLLLERFFGSAYDCLITCFALLYTLSWTHVFSSRNNAQLLFSAVMFAQSYKKKKKFL